MRIIPTSAAAASTLYMLHPLPVPDTKGRVKLVPRTRHDYSNKSSHRNVRKMLWDHPTKRWKNLNLSKFPHPGRLFSKKTKKNPKQELSSYLESKCGALFSIRYHSLKYSALPQTPRKKGPGEKNRRNNYIGSSYAVRAYLNCMMVS